MARWMVFTLTASLLTFGQDHPECHSQAKNAERRFLVNLSLALSNEPQQQSFDKEKKHQMNAFFDNLIESGLDRHLRMDVKVGNKRQPISLGELKQRINKEVKFWFFHMGALPGLSPVTCIERGAGLFQPCLKNVLLYWSYPMFHSIELTALTLHEALGALGYDDSYYQVSGPLLWLHNKIHREKMNMQELKNLTQSHFVKPLKNIRLISLKKMRTAYESCLARDRINYHGLDRVRFSERDIKGQMQALGGFGVDGGGDPWGALAKADLLLAGESWQPLFYSPKGKFEKKSFSLFVDQLHRSLLESIHGVYGILLGPLFCKYHKGPSDLNVFLGIHLRLEHEQFQRRWQESGDWKTGEPKRHPSQFFATEFLDTVAFYALTRAKQQNPNHWFPILDYPDADKTSCNIKSTKGNWSKIWKDRQVLFSPFKLPKSSQP